MVTRIDSGVMYDPKELTRFKMRTELSIGQQNVLVSTAGDILYGDISIHGKYETMVFNITKEGIDWLDLDVEWSQDAVSAEENHEKMVKKWIENMEVWETEIDFVCPKCGADVKYDKTLNIAECYDCKTTSFQDENGLLQELAH